MIFDGYGFYFEEQGRSGYEGAIDPAQQYFEGSHADHAIVRETGQNTLDNPGTDASAPIRMVFELKTMLVQDIPGIEALRKHIKAARDATKGKQGHDRLAKAADLAMSEMISVLRISDYNTTGLTGREDLSSSDSPLSQLTRGVGGSVEDGRGGSFGIGSAVGPMASDLCTVFYTSIPEDTGESVLAGYSRLATHTVDGISRRAEGFFTNLSVDDDFEYLRPAPPSFGPFAQRTEPGTDIYVLGYRMADRDPELERVRDAVIENFMAAIHRGKLIVEGRAPGNHWRLDAETLPGFTKRNAETHAFYEALLDPNPATKEIKRLGKVSLYINIDDRLDKKLHTVTMRQKLMKIDTFKHNSISAKYAAVLICDSDEGNNYLRQLEPPQHHEWDPARDPIDGRLVISKLKTFTREALKDRIGTEIGDEVKIDGLARFLPTDLVGITTSGTPAAPSSQPEAQAADRESSTQTGAEGSAAPEVVPPSRKVHVKVKRRAVNAGDQDSTKGKDRGGRRERKGDEAGLPGKGGEGDGKSRIQAGQLAFRSWSKVGSAGEHSRVTISVTSKYNERGDLKLVALGPGGTAESSYEIPIAKAVLHRDGKEVDLVHSANELKDIQLEAGKRTLIDIYVPAGERYRLGVE